MRGQTIYERAATIYAPFSGIYASFQRVMRVSEDLCVIKRLYAYLADFMRI